MINIRNAKTIFKIFNNLLEVSIFKDFSDEMAITVRKPGLHMKITCMYDILYQPAGGHGPSNT